MNRNLNKSDLENGFIKCESCSFQITLANYERLSVQKCPSCSAPNFIPTKISSYWLYQPLGGGGMGRVYKAISLVKDGIFAIKLLPATRTQSSQLVENLQREAQVGKALGEHKNIIPIIEYGEDKDDFFIVSEFAEGERLDNLISAKKHFEENETWLIALQIIEAEMHIISRGYLFRDLKPENIIIDKNGNLKLYDYGLCLPIEQASSGMIHSENIEGSPFYLPPERVVGAPEGEYSEIYSLGMVIFHMLTGKTYYSEAEIKDLITKHVTSLRISSTETHLKHCSKRTIEIIDKMIKRRPNDRYHSFSILKQEIETLITHLEEKAKSTSITVPPEILQKNLEQSRAKKVRVSMLILFTIFTLMIIILSFKIYSNVKKRKAITVKVSAKLGISPDIPLPTIPLQELKKEIEKRVKEKIDEEKIKFPQFDEKGAISQILKELSIKGNPKSPSLSLDELEKKRKNEIKEKEKKLENELLKNQEDEEHIVAEITKKLNLNTPIPKTDCSLTQALKKFEEFVKESSDKKFSNKERALLEMNIYNQYRPFRKGEFIKTMDASGKTVSGTYDGKSGGKVIIGGREILLTDIPVTQRFRFDEPLAEKKTSEAIERFREKYEEDKKKYEEEIRRNEKDKFLKNLGFISSNGKYTTIEDYIREQTIKIKKKNEDEIKKKIEERKSLISNEMSKDNYYRQNGFIKIRDKWLPEKEAVTQLLREKKEKYEIEKEKKLEEKKRAFQNELEKKIYESNGYIKYQGNWQPAKEIMEKLVEIELSAK
ncbi:MAG TPA: serine/threonine-protein kinase [Victivallales bacterium]|nr:serine/threonine-protein kinase [Victivallales bacterium]HPO91310.1 serine/threonine-protein kinase [Victivallales bacterium]HRR05842.1 serine/threonine-protein kinase [Victivallales bacterium]HRU01803.1 serine/threonine-protein kinase [Victivallales bacterium]